MVLPEQLIANCRKVPERQEWLRSLPAMLEELTSRWSLRIDAPFDHANVTCSWVASVLRADGTPAVLKLGMPHMEGTDEIHGLRFCNGDPTVQLLEADDERGAMLLERCIPGYMLRSEPEEKQDLLIAALLKRLWRRSTALNGIHAFRHLSELFIDPKPFVGDPPYDVVQRLHNCEARLHADPRGMVKRLGELAEVDVERLQLWTFARAAADPRPKWAIRYGWISPGAWRRNLCARWCSSPQNENAQMQSWESSPSYDFERQDFAMAKTTHPLLSRRSSRQWRLETQQGVYIASIHGILQLMNQNDYGFFQN